METGQHQRESINTSLSQATLAIEGVDTENLPKLPPATEPESQWQQIGRQISHFLEQLPEYLSSFFKEYKQPLITFALIWAAVVTAKIVLTLLDAINDIPLLSRLFELVGIGYTSWFIFRYLLKVSTRQQLVDEIQLLKNQFFG
ncbi:MAG: CAAD domain-containing protein [Nostoc sp.]|uniref:CAAD domain-containing protein n=1 Tax=Nostoc sp. TaxID=1180 RepID=UPI002FF84774